jgi:hypothetical protein
MSAVLSLAAVAGAQVVPLHPAYKFAAPANVGGAAETGTVAVTISSAGSLSNIGVLTQGVPNQDFTQAPGGSCATGMTYLPGQTCTIAVNFQAKYPGFRQGAVVLLASNGGVLGTELMSATGVGPTAVFVPGMISTVAGNGQWIFRGDGGPATQSPLFLPSSGVADAAGDLYISDSNNQRIRLVTASTGLMTTVAGNGIAGFGGDGGPATAAQLNTPTDVKLDGAGNFYIVDSGNHVVRVVNPSTGLIWTLAGIGGKSGYSGDNGPATQAHLAYPSAVAFDGDHALYISDTGNNVIRKVDLSTGIITTVAGTGVAGFSGDGGPAMSAQLNYPWGVTLGNDGSLYVADLSNNRIRKVSPGGTISTVVGTGTRGYGGDGGLATQAQLNVPASMLMDVAGNLYVADSGNQLVRKVNVTSGVINTIAGTYGGGIIGDGIAANTASLDGPYALFLDGPGNLYIADMFHQLIRIIPSNQAALAYPEIRVDRVSTPLSQAIENDGNASLNLGAFTLISNSALDPVSTSCSPSQSLPVNQSCVFGVEFAPTVTGNPVVGSLSITSTSPNSPEIINVSGQVLAVQPTTMTLTSNVNPAALNTAVTFTAVVSNQLPVAATGPVNFLDGTVQIGTGNLNTAGLATFTTSNLKTGSHSITAVYAGDSNNGASTSPALAETIKQSTSTALTSSQNPSTAGMPVTLNATVSGPAGSTTIPGGTVTFTDGATNLGQGTLNANGAATLTTSTLLGGQHSITASYAGDALDLVSQSAVLTQTENKAATTTALATSNASVPAGISITFTANVSRPDGMIPTGNVAFLDGTTTIGTVALNGAGTAVLAIATLAGGPHIITAQYAGDANNMASVSGTVSQTVQPLATATTIAAGSNPAVAGAPLLLTATVVQSATIGSGGAFTGTVTFSDGSTVLGSAAVSSTGIATLSISTLGVGPHGLSASYSGNANYVTSTSASLGETLVAALTTTALTSSQSPSNAGAQVTLTATVTSTGGIPGGTVTFLSGATTLGTAALNAKGVASIVTTSLVVGTDTLTAVYGGDPKDTGSTSSPLLQTVLVAASATTLASNANPSLSGTSVTFTAAVTTNGGVATGTVTFSDSNKVLGTAPVNAGTAVFSTSTLALGAHSITAAYGGDVNDAPSTSSALNQQVLQAGGVTVTSSANPAIAGAALSLTATISSPQSVPVTGTVTFKDGATPLGTASVGSTDSAVFTTTALAVGQHTIVAVYSGDSLNQAATSSVLVQTVQTAGTTVTLTSGANPALAGAPLTLTSTVVGTGGSVTGTVTFQDGTTALGAANLNSSGLATLSVTGLSPGAHSIIAVYSGDPNNFSSTSPALAQSIVQSTTIALTSSENPALALDAITFMATVSNGGSKPPTGTVVFSEGATTLGTGTLSAAGTATFTTSSLATGQHTIQASYGGDALNLAGVSPVLTEPVQLRPTSDTVSASSTSLTGGQQLTLISVVRYSGPVTPTGTVKFLSNSTVLGTATIDTTGVATLTVNPLTSTLAVTASYSGDSVYAASTSSQTNITVTPPTQLSLQLNPATVTVQTKQYLTATLTVTSLNNFTDKLDIGCVGLPYSATCTFSSNTVALAAGGTQVIQVVVDTGSPLTAGSQARLQRHTPAHLAAWCFLPGGALLALVLWRSRRRTDINLTGLLMLLLLAGITCGLSGCNGLQINGTPPGTYVFQITATGTGTGLTQTMDVTLKVTQ